jgi:hypothetical protein
MNIWKERFSAVLEDFSTLKSMTKRFPVSEWSPEYRALADKIHSMGRDHFHTDIIVELVTPDPEEK